MAVNDHNHLAFLVVLQDFVGPVDLRMLVNQTVARIVPDHLIGTSSLSLPRTPSRRAVISGRAQSHRST